MLRDDRPWGGADPPGVVFAYAPGRGGSHAEDMLKGFQGILQVDGYAGYNRLADARRTGGAPLRLACCWSHARREIIKAMPKAGSPVADAALAWIAALRGSRRRSAAARPTCAAPRVRSGPCHCRASVQAGCWPKAKRLSRKSGMGSAIACLLKHWQGLTVFAEDGRVERDSNLVENRIRPIALNRRNALFAGHDEGAQSWTRIAWLIGTCKLNGVEPCACLKATLEAIARGHPQSRLDDLLPWNFEICDGDRRAA